MRFVYLFALAVGLFVALPYVAHRLRRRRADERFFSATALVPPAPPQARARARLEDRALFGIRIVSVLALAILGASPLVRCSRLSLTRPGGASVAMVLVVDDSMSMRANDGRGTRLERAKRGAQELLASAREGDAIAVVLAGAPPRVALAPTTDLGTARAAVDAVTPSDRATDLSGAVGMAHSLVGQLPQLEKRIVLLSDRADGQAGGQALGEGSATPLWVALPDLGAEAPDCAVVTADRSGLRIRVALACSPGASAAGREVVVGTAKQALVRAAAPPGQEATVTLTLPEDTSADLVARLEGTDVIAADDTAPVVVEVNPGALAVVADAQGEQAATGGAPIVEQALSALKLDAPVRPLPVMPERDEDLSAFAGLLVDDPPGFTPEQRKALATYLESGGVVFLALGPRAAAASLGASLEPVLTRPSQWAATAVSGADATSPAPLLAEGAVSLAALAPRSRTVLAREDRAAFESLVAWQDGAPLVARKAIGRGVAWITTLPVSVEASDFALRPGFLAVLEAWADEVRSRSVPRRTEVGVPWLYPGARSVQVRGPEGPVAAVADGATFRFVPASAGLYTIEVDGRTERRVARVVLRELDLRPRAVAKAALGEGIGETRTQVDFSWIVALLLLGLLVAEMSLRLLSNAPQETA